MNVFGPKVLDTDLPPELEKEIEAALRRIKRRQRRRERDPIQAGRRYQLFCASRPSRSLTRLNEQRWDDHGYKAGTNDL
jgi:hypothetical protein